MHFGFDGFGMIIFWVVIIAVVVVLVKVLTKPSDLRQQSRTAMEILKERYAAGEISREEFESKKRDLVDK